MKEILIWSDFFEIHAPISGATVESIIRWSVDRWALDSCDQTVFDLLMSGF